MRWIGASVLLAWLAVAVGAAEPPAPPPGEGTIELALDAVAFEKGGLKPHNSPIRPSGTGWGSMQWA